MFDPAHKYALDVLDQLQRFNADLVVVDYMIIGAALGAEKAGVPCALLMHTPYALPARGAPPFGLGLAPARGLFGQLRDGLLRAFSRAFFNRLGLAQINAARSALGLAPLAQVFDQINLAQRVLVMTASEFDYASRAVLPANVRYVGPGLENPCWTAPYVPLATPADAAGGGGARHDVPEPGRAHGARNRGAGQFAGTRCRDPGRRVRPRRVHGARQCPRAALGAASRLSPRASAVVTHAGHGTVMKALSHGVPLLCLPLGRDQGDNAARVEASGTGLRLSPGASAARIRAALERLLREPSFQHRAHAMARVIARYQAEDAAVTELEALAQRNALRAVA